MPAGVNLTAAEAGITNGRLVDYFSSVPGTQRRELGTIHVDHDFSARDWAAGIGREK